MIRYKFYSFTSRLIPIRSYNLYLCMTSSPFSISSSTTQPMSFGYDGPLCRVRVLLSKQPLHQSRNNIYFWPSTYPSFPHNQLIRSYIPRHLQKETCEFTRWVYDHENILSSLLASLHSTSMSSVSNQPNHGGHVAVYLDAKWKYTGRSTIEYRPIIWTVWRTELVPTIGFNKSRLKSFESDTLSPIYTCIGIWTRTSISSLRRPHWNTRFIAINLWNSMECSDLEFHSFEFGICSQP